LPPVARKEARRGHGEWYDVGVRDLGLMAGALVLGRLASVYDPPPFRRR
jgi:hypothetical protein